MLCWGVYRFKDSQNFDGKFARPSSKRYVICNPDADFRLLPTDLVYVLQQFDPASTKAKTKRNVNRSQVPLTNKTESPRTSSKHNEKYHINLDSKKYESPQVL